MSLVTYTDLKRIISESITSVLTESVLLESQESKSISEAIRLYMENTGESYEVADNFIRVRLRASFPILRTKQGGKFVLGVTRMYVNNELNDMESVTKLNGVLKYVTDPTHVNQYDRNLNNLSAAEIINRFATARSQEVERDREDVGAVRYQVNPSYKVVPINSFEEAKKYGSYNDWCLAQDNGEGMFDEYTSNGINQLYFILRDGFENEPRREGPNAPFDSYGLSMMTVIVDPDGQMVQSTTRWNHENGSTDLALTTKQISETIGRNFYDIFKPNAKFKDAITDAIKMISRGKNPYMVFDDFDDDAGVEGLALVCLMGKWNILRYESFLGDRLILQDKHFLLNTWYDDILPFCEGFAAVRMNGKGSNFINSDGKLLSRTWFMQVYNFSDNVAVVYVRQKGWNAIDRTGRFISDMYFRQIDRSSSGLMKVEGQDLKINFLSTGGTLISDTWFDSAEDFNDNTAVVRKGWKFNILNSAGRLISDVWFDNVGSCFYDGFTTVYLHGKGGNYIDSNGRLLLNVWPQNTKSFISGYGIIEQDEKYNVVNTKGKILSDKWFDRIDYFHNGVARVKEGNKYNYINTEGKLISDTWFVSVDPFMYYGLAKVTFTDGNTGLIDIHGRVVDRN